MNPTLKGLDQWPNVAVRKINEHLSESYTFGPDSPSIPCTATCPKCSLPLSKGMALENTLVGFDDGFGATLSQTGPAAMVECLKCPSCGHSVHVPEVHALPPSSPVEAVSSTDRVETAEEAVKSFWRDYIGIEPEKAVDMVWNEGVVEAAFRAGWEAGRKA